MVFCFLHLAIYNFITLDIVTKNIVVNNITINSQEIVIIPYILSFKYIVNTKAAFGIGFNNDLTNRIVYIIIASVAFIGVLIYYIFTFKSIINSLER